MEKNLITQAERFLLTRHKDKRRTWLLRVLAVAVAFATIYVLIFPAITMSNEVECGMVEHVHTEACWQEQLTPPQPQLTCPFQGTGAMVLHTHDSFCYNQQGELICTLEERAAHTHGAECYREHRELICTQVPDPGHTHTAACYAQDRGGELICGLEESGQGHTHTQECYPLERMDEPQCGLEESEDVVDEATGEVTASGHHHTAQCWEKRVDCKLVCGLEESEDVVDEATGEVLVPGHHHSAECWLTGDELCYQYGCGQHESQGHTHSDSCYAWTPRLICQEEERPAGHVHTDECYEITQLFVCLEPEIVPHTHEAGCYDENGVLVCQLPEVVAHQHTAECFTTPEGNAEPVRTLICGMEEHQHTEQCYVRVEKDEGPTFYCGLEEHVHTMPDCFFETGTLRCTLTEHVHDLTCLEPPVEASDDPEQTQDPAESEEPEPSESQEPEQTVVEGVELVDAQFSDVYSTAEFTMSFYVNGFAQVAEEHDQDQSQDQEPLRLPDPMPTHSGEEFIELVENMVPLAAMPRMTAYAAPMSSGMEGVDPPAMVQTDSVTTPGSDIEPEGTAVDNSGQVILNDPLLPEDHTEGGQQASESLPASVEPATESGLPSAEPTPEADDSSAQPERVLLDPSQVRFVVEPLEDGGDEWEAALAATAELGEEEQAMVLQMFTVAAYAGDGRKLDMAGWDVEAEVVFSDELLDYAESAGEEQLSTIETDGESGEESAEDVGTVISVLDLETSEEMAYASVSSVRASARSLRFAVKASKAGDSKVGLMLIKNVYPHFDVQYYAELDIPSFESADGVSSLPFIDTTGGELPQNGPGTPNLKNLQLDKDGNVVFKENQLTPIYRKGTYTFNPNNEDLSAEGMFSMMTMEGTQRNYRLKELWVLKEEMNPTSTDKNDWMVYEGTEEHLKKTLQFTNNPAAAGGNVILIRETSEEKTTIRLVYEPQKDTKVNDATFFDYDITENGSASSKTKKGINSPSNYPDEGADSSKAHFAFGNAAANSGWDWVDYNANPKIYYGEDWGGNALNMANNSSRRKNANGEKWLGGYGDCTYGLVTGVNADTGTPIFAEGVSAPDLFSLNTVGVTGKTVYNGSSLTFDVKGDTHTLTLAQVKESKEGAVLSSKGDLDRFKHPQEKYPNMWTNNFWPMDSVEHANQDPLFGNSKPGGLPASDDGKDHNSYFGMTFTLEVPLDKDYVGPLEYYFYGDDDMWVVLDGKTVVCDIGGVHSSVGQYVNLWDYLGVADEDGVKHGDGQKHTLQFFYTERGASGSTCWMQYTLPNAKSVYNEASPPGDNPNPLAIKKLVSGNAAGGKDTTDFTFELTLEGTSQRYEIRVTDKNEARVGMKLEGDVYVRDTEWDPTAEDASYLEMWVAGEKPVKFQLRDGWKATVIDLPYGVKYKVQEIPPKGEDCTTSWDLGGRTVTGTTTGEFQVLGTGGITATCTNVYSYELPETGGAGSWYTMACVPLLAAGCLWYKKKSQGEGAADDV